MALLKTSLICTVFNEQDSIAKLIDSIANQSLLPLEVIIVDGGSSDDTTKIIKNKTKEYKRLNLKLFVEKGNRSVGRNKAIKEAKGEIILITDAGCYLDKNWVKNIVKPFKNANSDVVAGYYEGKPKNVFQKSLIPYALVMEDRINPQDFLPATRSMAIKKKVWKEIGGFDELLSHNEDYAFSNRLKEKNFKIVFQKDAIAYWIPRKSFFDSFKMFFRFSYGDIQAGILREKVVYIFLRYLLGLYLLLLSFIMKSLVTSSMVVVLIFSYVAWSIYKNYKYVDDKRAFFYLPALQLTSDIAVMSGSLLGFCNKINLKSIIHITTSNKGLVIVIFSYSLLMISMIEWGIPNFNHPFNYFMDEWHQAQSIKNLFTFGSPNIEGSANGSIFHFFLSGLFLIPFIITGIVNPFAINSSVLNLEMQHRLFEVLRLNTLMFGIFSILVFYYICKKYLKVNALLAVFFFTFNPAWIMLSNYFKYDIALMFWTLVSFLFILRYANKPNTIDFILAAFFSALAISVKLFPFVLLAILTIVFALYRTISRRNLLMLAAGLVVYFSIFFVFGIPDILLGKGSLYELLTSVLQKTPSYNVANTILGTDIWRYLYVDLYPSLFGHAFYFLFLVSIVMITTYVLLNFKKISSIVFNKREMFIIIISFVLFLITLYPLKLDASNNRALTLLPFIAIFAAYLVNLILKIVKNSRLKYFGYFLISCIIIIQLIETFSWVGIKLSADPRQLSSGWILNNIPKGSTIGIENIPIYQGLPDILVKEFYSIQYDASQSTNYKYKIINGNTNEIPQFIILTNADFEKIHFRKSDKKEILHKLEAKKYRRISDFSPSFVFLKTFTNDFNYYLSGIVQMPLSISIYERI